MNKKILAIATFALLFAGQTAVAQNNAEEFLSWLDGGHETVQQVAQENDFNKVSIKQEQAVDSTYQAENDIFSIHYMSAN